MLFLLCHPPRSSVALKSWSKRRGKERRRGRRVTSQSKFSMITAAVWQRVSRLTRRWCRLRRVGLLTAVIRITEFSETRAHKQMPGTSSLSPLCHSQGASHPLLHLCFVYKIGQQQRLFLKQHHLQQHRALGTWADHLQTRCRCSERCLSSLRTRTLVVQKPSTALFKLCVRAESPRQSVARDTTKALERNQSGSQADI